MIESERKSIKRLAKEMKEYRALSAFLQSLDGCKLRIGAMTLLRPCGDMYFRAVSVEWSNLRKAVVARSEDGHETNLSSYEDITIMKDVLRQIISRVSSFGNNKKFFDEFYETC